MTRAALAALALAALLGTGGVGSSGADFTASSPSPSNSFTAAADFNTVAVTMTDPATPLRGTIALDAVASSDRGIESVRFQSSPAGAGSWTDACTASSAPYSCDWDSSAGGDGPRDLRAVAIDLAGYQRSSVVAGVVVDNTPPAVPTLNDPGVNLQGSLALSGTAADTGSGIAAWIVQYRPAGGGAWADACSAATSPYGCSWDTTGVADALYDLRAVARDQAGNETPSTTLTNRPIDNNGPTVTLADPGAYLRGTVTLSATAGDPAGVQSVVFERQLTSGGSPTTICTDTTAPYTCSFNTIALNGTYDLRARATDTVGHASTSTVGARVIDNTSPAAAAVEAVNGGTTAGRLEAGDWLRLTWTEAIAPGSVLTGWDGSTIPVRVRVRDANGSDRLTIWNSSDTTRLNLTSANGLRLNANFVTTDASFDATLTRSGTAFTITLGARLSGTLATATTASIRWTPSNVATDLAGNAANTTSLTEPGPADVDF